jgi:transposase
MENYFLGIDVSKGYSNLVMLDSDKRCVEEDFQLDDVFEGHQKLYGLLSTFSDRHPGANIFAAVESTGGYENNWFNALVRFQEHLPVKVTRLNPFGVSHNSKAGLDRNTTDKISAKNVAEYLIAHPEKVQYQEQDPLSSLRKQWVFVKLLQKQKKQLAGQLESNLYTANPELLSYCKNYIPNWVYSILARYPTAARLAKARASSLSSIPYVTSRRADELIRSAKESVASATDEIVEQIIKTTVQQIMQLKKTIAVHKEAMADKCSLPEVELLETFVGIGNDSAVGLMLDIGTIERFSSAKKLASFFGLHPVYRKSGDGSWGMHMSKMGRKAPRQILYMVSIVAIQSNPLIREIYEKHVGNGMKKKAALGVCMHKIIRIIYGMLKHNKPFDPEIDRRNSAQQRPQEEEEEEYPSRSRRYQAYDAKAPISRRQGKKREEQKQSQSVKNAQCGIEASVPLTET